MADLHHHHDAPGAVVTDSDGPSAVLIAVIVLLLVGFLIWLFAFSGIVMDRDGGGTTINDTERNTEIVNPPAQGDTDTTNNTTNVNPSP